MKTYIVDHIEGDKLIVETEDEQFYAIEKALLPEAKEGDCITLYINKEETEKRREKMREILNQLFEN
ncbi:MAG: DUF3006 domain-containing protein [Clostridia bacterium]|nr:DUF3006 domain-containing protein [Clostridia bacterium]